MLIHNLVLIHNNVEEPLLLKSSFKNSEVILYNNQNSDELLENINKECITHNIKNLVLVFHPTSKIELPFFNSSLLSENRIFRNGLIELINKLNINTLDLLACSLNNNYFIESVKEIEKEMGIIIRYSLDNLGNKTNWILDSHNIDIKDVYFNENIERWNYSLNYDIPLEVTTIPSSNSVIINYTEYTIFEPTNIVLLSSFSGLTVGLKPSTSDFSTGFIISGLTPSTTYNGGFRLRNNDLNLQTDIVSVSFNTLNPPAAENVTVVTSPNSAIINYSEYTSFDPSQVILSGNLAGLTVEFLESKTDYNTGFRIISLNSKTDYNGGFRLSNGQFVSNLRLISLTTMNVLDISNNVIAWEQVRDKNTTVNTFRASLSNETGSLLSKKRLQAQYTTMINTTRNQKLLANEPFTEEELQNERDLLEQIETLKAEIITHISNIREIKTVIKNEESEVRDIVSTIADNVLVDRPIASIQPNTLAVNGINARNDVSITGNLNVSGRVNINNNFIYDGSNILINTNILPSNISFGTEVKSVSDVFINSDSLVNTLNNVYTKNEILQILNNIDLSGNNWNNVIYTTSEKVGVNIDPSYNLDVSGNVNFTGDLLKNGALFAATGYEYADKYEFYNASIYQGRTFSMYISDNQNNFNAYTIFKNSKLTKLYIHQVGEQQVEYNVSIIIHRNNNDISYNYIIELDSLPNGKVSNYYLTAPPIDNLALWVPFERNSVNIGLNQTYQVLGASISQGLGRFGQNCATYGISSGIGTTEIDPTPANWSMCFWFKFMQTNATLNTVNDTKYIVFMKNTSEQLNGNFSMGLRMNQIRFLLKRASTTEDVSVTVAASDAEFLNWAQEWHHYAITKSGNTINIYLDGALIITRTFSDITWYISPISFGTTVNYYKAHDSSGKVDDIRWYTRTLTAAEVNRFSTITTDVLESNKVIDINVDVIPNDILSVNIEQTDKYTDKGVESVKLILSATTALADTSWEVNDNGIHINSNVGINKIADNNYDLDVSGDINYSGNLYQNGSIINTSRWDKSGNLISYVGDVSINGFLYIDEPVSNNNATTKLYVDTKFNDLISKCITEPKIKATNSNTWEGYVAESSSVLDVDHQPYKAFDGDLYIAGSSWSSQGNMYLSGEYIGDSSFNGISGEWIKLTLPETKTIHSYSLYYRASISMDYMVSKWLLYGSLDNVNWVVLDDKTQNPTTIWNIKRVFNVANPVSVNYLALVAISPVGDVDKIDIQEIEYNLILPKVINRYEDKVGINKIPEYNFDISGTLNFSGEIYKDGVIFVGSRWESSGNNIGYHLGNVGINKEPEYTFDISGDLNITGNILQNGMIISYETITDLQEVIYGTEEVLGIKSLLEDVNDYVLASWQIGGSYVNYNGNVGINTIPLYSLDISGDININGNILKNGEIFNGTRWDLSNNNISYTNGGVNLNNKLLVDNSNVILTADLIPLNETYSIGAIDKKIKDVYIGSLYVDNNKLIGVSGEDIEITSNNLSIISDNSGILKLQTNDGNIILDTSGANSDIILKSDSSVRINAPLGLLFETNNGIKYFDNKLVIQGDILIDGSLNIMGTQTIINTENLSIQDNIITLNSNQEIDPNVGFTSGVEINRGLNRPKYHFKFRELGVSGGVFEVGEENDMQPVATRNEAELMTNNGLIYWNEEYNRLDSMVDILNDAGDLRLNNKKLYINGMDIDASINELFTLSDERATKWIDSSNNISYMLGNVGLGINNPDYNLDVSGVIRVVNTHAILRFQRNGENAGQGWNIGSAGAETNDFYIYGYNSGSGNGHIRLFTQGSERLIVTNNGNIGMGTSDPVYNLEVSRTSTIVTSGISYLSGRYCNFYAGSSTAGINFDNSGYFSIASGTSKSSTNSNGLIVSGNNNVGINNSNPLYTLDISGSINFTGDLLHNNILFSPTNITTSVLELEEIIYGSENITGLKNLMEEINDYVSTSWQFDVSNADNINYMTGNVGIGISNPVYSLDVSGDINLNGIIRINGTEFNPNSSQWTTNDTDIYYNSGSVSIGGSNLGNFKFNVRGTNSKTQAESLIRFETNDASPNRFMVKAIGSATAINQGWSINTEEDGVSNNRVLSLQPSGGRVGVGTAIPNHVLHVYGSTPARFENTSLNSSQLILNDSSNSSKELNLGYDITNDIGLIYAIEQGTGYKNIQIGAPEGGNIGIGKTNPTFKIDISGDINFTGVLRQNGDPYVGCSLWNISGDILYYSDGNIGIGTSAPIGRFVISNDSSGHITFDTLTGENNGLTSIGFNGGYSTEDYVLNTEKTRFRIIHDTRDVSDVFMIDNYDGNNTNNILSMLPTGNVGISNTNPSFRLDVSGDINFTGVLRQNGEIYYGCTQWTNSDDDIYFNTGNVGLGAVSPSATLHIAKLQDISTNIDLLKAEYDSNWGIRLEQSYTVSGNIQYNWKHRYDNIDYNLLTFRRNNIGMGTLTPESKLHIQSEENTDCTLRIKNTNVGSSAYSVIKLLNSNSSGLVLFLNSTGRNTDGGINNATLRNDIGNLRLQSSGSSNGINIQASTGFVGIGNTNPSYLLDVSGDINFNGLLRHNGEEFISSKWESSGNYIYRLNTFVGINNEEPLFDLDVVGDINMTGDLYQNGVLYSLETISSKWTVSGDDIYFNLGNIGVGNNDPQFRLDVSGDINMTGDLYQNGVLYSLETISSKWTVSGDDIYFNLGNIGVGNNSPQFKLDVSGDINMTGDLYQNGVLYSLETISSKWTVSGDDIYFNLGNIGVGNNDPQFRLDVSGDINMTGDLYQNGVLYSLETISSKWTVSGDDIYFNLGNIGVGNNSPQFKLDVSGDINMTGDLYQNGVLYSLETISSKWTVSGDDINYVLGNVGVGNNDPQFKLDVSGDINMTGDLYQNGVLYSLETISSKWTVSGDDIYFNLGNIGVGNNSPQFKLDVSGDINMTGDLYQDGVLVDFETFGSNWNVSGEDINYVLGNVGVGNNSPQFKLDVSGDINMTGGLYQNGVLLELAVIMSKWTVSGDTINYVLGNVGVGNNNPQFRLDVSGDINMTGDLYQDGV
jgi:hypothetical protein